jgi:hypothetical protein
MVIVFGWNNSMNIDFWWDIIKYFFYFSSVIIGLASIMMIKMIIDEVRLHIRKRKNRLD